MQRGRAIANLFAPARRLLMLAVLLTFAFQAYAVQTHLHGQPIPGRLTRLAHDYAPPAAPLSNDPLDPATCKLCQELVHAGAAITPAGPEMTLLLAWVAGFFLPVQMPVIKPAPETGWQSRAPPRR